MGWRDFGVAAGRAAFGAKFVYCFGVNKGHSELQKLSGDIMRCYAGEPYRTFN